MRRILLLSTALALTACQPGSQPQDLQAFFDSLEAPQQSASTYDSLMANAKNAETRGNYLEAASLYKRALSERPDNMPARLALAETYHRADDIDQALLIYNALLIIDSHNLDAMEGKALALMSRGDFNTPTNLFDHVMKADSTRWKTLNGLGILFATRNMYGEAGQYFQEALKYSPSNASVLGNMALIQALTKNYDQAVSDLSLASSLTARNSVDRKRIDMNLALVYAAMGRLDEAQGITSRYYYGQALENNVGIYTHLANDRQLSDTYLYMALTENKSFYERALSKMQTAATQPASSFADMAPAAGGNAAASSIITDPTVGAVPATAPVTITVVGEEPAATPIPKMRAKLTPPAPVEAPKPVAKAKPKPTAAAKPAKPVKLITEAKADPAAVKPALPEKKEIVKKEVEKKEASKPLVIRVEQPKPEPKPVSNEDRALANIIGATGD